MGLTKGGIEWELPPKKAPYHSTTIMSSIIHSVMQGIYSCQRLTVVSGYAVDPKRDRAAVTRGNVRGCGHARHLMSEAMGREAGRVVQLSSTIRK